VVLKASMTREHSKTPKPVPVAQYLRMSTEHQQYSTANQSIAILQYAQQHNMEVVRTYADHGKSGLSLSARSGLKQLIADAMVPNPGFEAILVYDVSRWGRFQNPDQAASYEYMLQTANITIHYCAEQFQNDGTLASSILKTLKRGMAGEYSRELSGKVWAGNCRIAELGFHIGGYAGYGLRRQLVGQNRMFKQILQQGEIKGLQSDHVILVPGPRHEIRVIHRIYKMFIEELLCEREIAERLNNQGIPWIGVRPWTRMCVRHILTNPKYIGASVYNRTSYKLRKAFVRNPRSEWIWRDEAFEPIVSREWFEQARVISASRARSVSTQSLLNSLKAFIKREGRVSERLIESSEGMPSATTYINRFGSLRNAYQLAGWKPHLQQRFIDLNVTVAEHRRDLIAQLLVDLAPFGVTVKQDKKTCLFTTTSGISISFVVTRCSPIKNHDYWNVYFPPKLIAHFYVVARMKPTNDGILDHFIFPKGVIVNSRVTIGANNARTFEIHRFDTLNTLGATLRLTEVRDTTPDHFNESLTPSETLSTLQMLPRLSELRSTTKTLIADENFRTLLRAERCEHIPEVLWRDIADPREQQLAVVVCESHVALTLSQDRIRRYIARHHANLLSLLEPVG
jgi:DNA invertase Pin-like site-specific DNA recombinase